MEKKTKTLLGICGALFLTSLIVYKVDHYRPENQYSGSEFITGLDVEKISKVLIEGTSEKVAILRENNEFFLENFEMFPADIEKVNNFLFKIKRIYIQKMVSKDKKTFDDFQVGEQGKKYAVTFFNPKGEKYLKFFVGKNHEKKGSYIRLDGSNEIFLSDESVFFNTGKDGFIDKTLYSLTKKEVEQIKLSRKNNGFLLQQENDRFSLVKPVKKSVDHSKIDSFVNGILNLQFKNFVNSAAISENLFKDHIKISLNNKISYLVHLGKNKEKYFVKVSADASGLPTEIKLEKTADNKELENINSMLVERDKVVKFNQKNTKWIYEVEKNIYENLSKKVKDFLNKS